MYYWPCTCRPLLATIIDRPSLFLDLYIKQFTTMLSRRSGDAKLKL